jgi:hypoxanthine phosphoribosyltransferase
MSTSSIPCLLSADQLAHRTSELAQRISADHAGQSLVVVGVLKGAWVFMADLVRELAAHSEDSVRGSEGPVRGSDISCDFVMLSSYGQGTSSSGQIKLRLDVSLPLEGRHVLVVEDVLDTGLSMAWLLEHLKTKRPASLKLCVLLDKPSRRKAAVQVDYVGFEIPDRFVVGYGIDCAEQHRELPYVGYVPEKEALGGG